MGLFLGSETSDDKKLAVAIINASVYEVLFGRLLGTDSVHAKCDRNLEEKEYDVVMLNQTMELST